MAQPNSSLLTTGQAAKLCEVTPDTILKWIRKGRLRGTRTAGGHFRISPDNLQPLLPSANGTTCRTEQAAPATTRKLPCWEYLSQDGTVRQTCKQCMVYKTRTAGCLELAGGGNGRAAGLLCKGSCEDCVYFRRVGGLSTNVLVISPDKTLRERLAAEENDSITLRIASDGYEAGAMVQDFAAAFVIVDEELLVAKDERLLHSVRNDPRLPGAKIVLALRHGSAGRWHTASVGRDKSIVFGLIEKPFGLSRIMAVVNSLPIESSSSADMGEKTRT